MVLKIKLIKILTIEKMIYTQYKNIMFKRVILKAMELKNS